MLLTVLGNIGVGLVWGWLIGMFERGPHNRTFVNRLVLGASLLLATSGAFLLSGWLAVALLPGAAGLALLTHHIWQRSFQYRNESTT